MSQSYEEVYNEWLAFQEKRMGLMARKAELERTIKTAQADLASVVRDLAPLEEKTNEMVEKLAQATIALTNNNPCTAATGARGAPLPPLLLRRMR